MRLATFISILFISGSVLFSQKADTAMFIFSGSQVHYGFIIPHSDAIEEVSHTKPYGFEVNINRINTSYESWKIFNTYWISGLQAGYFNFQNPEVVGGNFMISVFAEPIVSFGRRYIFSLRGGTGLSYHTVIFNANENPLNKFFSTRLNFPLFLGFRYSYKVNQNIFLNITGNYNHISNGGIKHPNYGMNFPTASVGFQYYHKSIPVLSKGYLNRVEVVKPGISIQFQALSGYKVIDKTDIFPEKGAFVSGFNIRVAKQLKTYYQINGGAEIIFDGGIKETIRRDSLNVDYKRLAITAGQDFLFGKAVFTQYFGFYVYSPYKARNAFYQKYEMGYRIYPRITLGVYLKAHLHVAELMGVNVNFMLLKRP